MEAGGGPGILISLLVLCYGVGVALPTTTTLPCDEGTLARCLRPLTDDVTFGSVLTTSGAFDLVSLNKDGEALCRMYAVVEPCATTEMSACAHQVSGTYSAIVTALKTFCDDGIKVLADFPCLQGSSFLEEIATCQVAAGLYVDIQDLVCRTSPSLRRCVDEQVLASCDVTAVERYQVLSEGMLLPLRQRHGCPPVGGPGPVRGAPPPADCGPALPDCLPHLAALTGSTDGVFEVADLLTRAPRVCRAYSGVKQCLPSLGDCREAVSTHLEQYDALSDFCSLNLTALEQHPCLQGPMARAAATRCITNLTTTLPTHVNACRYIFTYQSCLGRAVESSCGADVIADVTGALEATFEPLTVSTKCARVLPVYASRPCLAGGDLAGRLEVCQLMMGSTTHNSTGNCSVLVTFDRCVQQAARAVCGEDAVPDIRPLVDRVLYDFYSRYPACSKGESPGDKPSSRPPIDVAPLYQGLLTPQFAAFCLLALCALVTVLTLCGAYCVLHRDSVRRRQGRTKRPPGGSDDGQDAQGQDADDQDAQGQLAGSGESALEVEEVKVEPYSIEEHQGW